MGNYNSLTQKYITEHSIEKRLQAYDRCIKFKEDGFKTIEIWKILKKEGIEIKYETIRRWVKGERTPHKRLNTIQKFDETLPYIIGLLIGDGCFYKVMKDDSYNHGRITLAVKDKDLAQRFALSISYIFGNKRKYKLRLSNDKRVYIVELGSKELVEILLRQFEDLMEIIKISESSFIRGFFDAEGCINIKYQNDRIYPRILLTNSDMTLINYVRDYFEKIGIMSSLQINTKKGKEKVILGRKTKTTKDCYNLSIENFKGVKKFAEEINFSVHRKKDKLNKVIRHIEKHGNKITQNKNLLSF